MSQIHNNSKSDRRLHSISSKKSKTKSRKNSKIITKKLNRNKNIAKTHKNLRSHKMVSKKYHKLSKQTKSNEKNYTKLSAKENVVQEYIKTHSLLKLSDFTDLQQGQQIVITFIHNEDKLHTFIFKFDHIEPVKGKQKHWYTHNIYGFSSYTKRLPLGVKKSTGEIRFAESSDISPAYLDKPIVIKKFKHKKLRPSPSESATLFKVGTKKIGNDNNIWIIVETNTGTKRWKLIK